MRKFYLKKSKIEGKGLFAKKEIKKGEVVGEFKGRIYSTKEVERKKLHIYLFQIDWEKWMYVKTTEKYINHSCSPNTYIKQKTKIAAFKNIKKGDELTIDYDTLEWDYKKAKIKCKCGTKSCRKILQGYKYLDTKTKKRYNEFIADFLKTKYKESLKPS